MTSNLLIDGFGLEMVIDLETLAQITGAIENEVGAK